MGIFSFNKSAGAKTPDISDEAKAKFMVNTINKYNLDVEDLKINVKDETASVWGKVKEQSVKEKIVLGIGNVVGISEVDDNLTLQKQEANEVEDVTEAKFYTVEKGDSLSKISKKVYGDAMKYNSIFEANKPMLKDVNLIYPGQVLRIPELD